MEKHIGKLKIFYQDPKVVENYERKRKFKDDDVSLLHVSEIEGLKNIVKEARGHILEIAVGTGRIARNLQSNASIYLGIDFSLPMLFEARKTTDTLTRKPFLVRADAFCLPAKRESFDAVICFRFFHHLEKCDRDALYNQIRDVFKKNGLLVFDLRQNSAHRKKALSERKKLLLSKLNEYFKELSDHGFKDMKFLGNRYGLDKFFPKFLKNRRLLVKAIGLLEMKYFNRFEFLQGLCRGGIIFCKKG